MKKESEERGRSQQFMTEELVGEKARGRELEANLMAERKKTTALTVTTEGQLKELKEIVPLLEKKVESCNRLQVHLDMHEKEKKELESRLEILQQEHSTSQTQLVVLKDLRKDRDRMRKAAQGMWLLFQSNMPALRASVVGSRGTVMHDIEAMRAEFQEEIKKLDHMYQDILIKTKRDSENEAAGKISAMLSSTQATHLEILQNLHSKEMELVSITSERDTLKSQLEGKITESEILRSNNRVLTSNLENRNVEISTMTRDKGDLEQHSKKALALAIQQLEMEMKAKESQEASLKKLMRGREEDSRKLAGMSELLSEKSTHLDQLEESRYRDPNPNPNSNPNWRSRDTGRRCEPTVNKQLLT